MSYAIHLRTINKNKGIIFEPVIPVQGHSGQSLSQQLRVWAAPTPDVMPSSRRAARACTHADWTVWTLQGPDVCVFGPWEGTHTASSPIQESGFPPQHSREAMLNETAAGGWPHLWTVSGRPLCGHRPQCFR